VGAFTGRRQSHRLVKDYNLRNKSPHVAVERAARVAGITTSRRRASDPLNEFKRIAGSIIEQRFQEKGRTTWLTRI
jgi:hypothetical protein